MACVQVVGFSHGYHAMAVMASGAKLARGRRLAQVAGVRLALHSPAAQPDGGRAKLFMQLDGEPWEQPVPAGASQQRVVVSAGRSVGCWWAVGNQAVRVACVAWGSGGARQG